jgi:NAD(P)-dependent dehydrogenase (short-subunit alcohol dehydrogenase family)
MFIFDDQGGSKMDLGLSGKIALVTAASRGLGRGCAEQLAAEKCRVAICSRDEATAKQAAEEISTQNGTEVVGFGADVSRVEDINRLLEAVKQSLGDPEILVTNAGGPPPGTFQEDKSPEEVIRDMMSANPSNTIGDPADFGAAAAFLAGMQARYITGQNLLVDGGNYSGLL